MNLFTKNIKFKLGFLLMTALLTITDLAFSQSQLQINLIQSTESCKDDGSATLNVSGGVAPYAVYWIIYTQSPVPPGGSVTDTVATGLSASGLKPGYYQIRVIDSSTPNPKQGYYSVFIAASFHIQPRITHATCANKDGKIIAEVFDSSNAPKGPFSFEWSNGINHLNQDAARDSITNIGAGNYSLKVTDGNGCWVKTGPGSGSTNYEGLYVRGESPITYTSKSTPSNCFDGTASVKPANGTEPYTFVWNTNPVQTNDTAFGLPPGYATVTITDFVGCTATAYVSVPAGPNYLQATAVVNPETCDQVNGAINMNITGGKAPYSFNWSNGATTEDLSGISSGYYQLEITDDLGCKLKVYKHVPKHSPIHINISSTQPGCNLSDGSLNAQVSGGAAPYTYSWNNGAANTNPYTNLKKGYYYVQVTDANGCKANEGFNLKEPESCLAHIRGRIVNDFNANCQTDAGEGGLANVIVYAKPGAHYATTDANGYYSIALEAGDYEVSAVSPSHWNQQCPINNGNIQVSASAPGTVYSGNNFFLTPDSVFNDMQVFVSSGPARPGFNMTWYLFIRNAGTTMLSPTLQFTHDGLLSYLSSSPNASAYNPSTKTLSWNIPTMAPQSTQYYYVTTKLPVSAVLGDSVSSSATISISGVDVAPLNNYSRYARLITGSYDPNDKQVSPAGIGEEGLIQATDSVLTYLIRFQNSGTDTAFTVVVRDTLDQNLDIPSFQLLGTSHPVDYKLSDQGILKFTFDNILLPDSNINEPASHGYIEYQIKKRNDLAMGATIHNTASIYFDFNPPIQTNTTVNTLYDATVSVTKIESSEMLIWPNPSSGLSRLTFNLQESSPVQIVIYDINGRIIYRQHSELLNKGVHHFDIDRSMCNDTDGTYLISIETPLRKSGKLWIVSGK